MGRDGGGGGRGVGGGGALDQAAAAGERDTRRPGAASRYELTLHNLSVYIQSWPFSDKSLIFSIRSIKPIRCKT